MVKYAGAISGVVNTTDILDGTVSVDDLTTGAARKVLLIPIADLGAGADLAEFAVAKFDVAVTVLAAGVLGGSGSPAGIDDANTSVHTLKNGAGGSTIVTKTYNTGTAFAAANTEDDFGAVANASIPANGIITYTVLNAGGEAADLQAYTLVIEYE